MRPVNTSTLKAVTVSANSAAPILTNFIVSCSLQVIATGTIAGAVKLQFSNDPVSAPAVPTNWNDIPSATVTLTGAAGAFAIPKTDICYNWVRSVFTASGGAGTVTDNFQGFGF